MRNVIDSLALYLQRELQGAPRVNRMRAVLNDPESTVMQNEAVNLKIIDIGSFGAVESVVISLDVIGPEEELVLTWCERIKQALLEEYAPEMSFVNGTMMNTGNQIYWENADLQFTHVHTNQGYVHYNCTLPVRHAQRYT